MFFIYFNDSSSHDYLKIDLISLIVFVIVLSGLVIFQDFEFSKLSNVSFNFYI